jgi:superfamily II DNA or RNA helicase
LATGSYIGEGFDDARLDTLLLAMPISWKGTLQQYVGRLQWLYDAKHVVRVYDYVDSNVPMLARMYARRLKGYSAIGYRICNTPKEVFETERQATGFENARAEAVGENGGI